MAGWCFFFPGLPVSANHQYAHLPNGGKALTREARDCRQMIEMLALASGFRFDKTKCYAVTVWLTMPSWSGGDVDGRSKLLLDSIFGSRGDHRVTELHIRKLVRPGEKLTRVEIQECAAL